MESGNDGMANKKEQENISETNKNSIDFKVRFGKYGCTLTFNLSTNSFKHFDP